MARVYCLAVSQEEGVKRRGKPLAMWDDENGKPQIYCRGYLDASTEAPLETCRNCRDFVGSVECENDFKEFQKRTRNIK